MSTKPFALPDWYKVLGLLLWPIVAILGHRRMGRWTRSTKPTVWIHASSLGETKGLLTLADALGDVSLTLTSTTGSGLRRIRTERGDLKSYLLPMDQRDVVAKFVQTRNIRCAVFLEAEAWPATLATLKKMQIPVALAAARCGPESVRNWNRLRAYFPGITRAFDQVWVDGASRSLDSCGFENLRDGSSLKWAGVPARKGVTVVSHRSAAISLHPSDLPALKRLVRRNPRQGWIWFPRNIWQRPLFVLWARFLGLRMVSKPTSVKPGEVWISPRLGMVQKVLPGCASAWVSPGHDRIEPLRLGVPDLLGISAPESLGNVPSPEGTREDIASWVRGIVPPERKLG